MEHELVLDTQYHDDQAKITAVLIIQTWNLLTARSKLYSDPSLVDSGKVFEGLFLTHCMSLPVERPYPDTVIYLLHERFQKI